MRAVVQRVRSAEVHIESDLHAQVGQGLLVYLGVGKDDAEEDSAYLADKVRHLRIFPDGEGKMNLDVGQAGGEVLVVSAFTTQGDARKGRRPSFDPAARPEQAEPLVERFCRLLQDADLTVHIGVFGAYMNVISDNDGPICVLLDSKRTF